MLNDDKMNQSIIKHSYQEDVRTHGGRLTIDIFAVNPIASIGINRDRQVVSLDRVPEPSVLRTPNVGPTDLPSDTRTRSPLERLQQKGRHFTLIGEGVPTSFPIYPSEP